jgi:hypothetical protein
MSHESSSLINHQNIESNGDIELGYLPQFRHVASFYLHHGDGPGLSPIRPSLEFEYGETQHCDIHIRDDALNPFIDLEDQPGPDVHFTHQNSTPDPRSPRAGGSELPKQLRQKLEVR